MQAGPGQRRSAIAGKKKARTLPGFSAFATPCARVDFEGFHGLMAVTVARQVAALRPVVKLARLGQSGRRLRIGGRSWCYRTLASL